VADEKYIYAYVQEERERVAALLEEMDCSGFDDKQFLLYCILAPVYSHEIVEQRKRFEEMQDPEIEGLM
jgi:hypothetical protein